MAQGFARRFATGREGGGGGGAAQRPGHAARSGSSALVVAFGHVDDRPLDLVSDPVLVCGLDDFRLMNDACLDPCVFRLGRMQRKNRRTASAAKTPLNLPAAAAH